MIIAKLSRTTENLKNLKNPSNIMGFSNQLKPPVKEPPLWDVITELSSDSDGTEKEAAESSNIKQSKINLKQQLHQIRLQKKLAFNKYQNQQLNKTSQGKDIYLSGTCVIIGDSILKGIIEENLPKKHNIRKRKFPGATVDDLNNPKHHFI